MLPQAAIGRTLPPQLLSLFYSSLLFLNTPSTPDTMTSTPPSPSLSSSATSQAPPAKNPPTPPVPLLPTQAAKTYALAHPLLLLSLLALRFEHLVADPMAELLNSLPLLTVLQAGYVTVCLPAAGGGSPGTGSRGVGYRRKQHGQGAGGSGAIFSKLIVLPPIHHNTSID